LETSGWPWLSRSLLSYEDFCREAQELANDADVAALVRASPEGLKGLYVLLPTKCETHE
jgi:hypothetical protein